MSGRTLPVQQAAGNAEIFNISRLAKGIYLVQIVREDVNVVVKLVVK